MSTEALERMAEHRPASAAMDWQRDGADWPLREYSRFVSAGGLRWHVQQLGAGPQLLLVHGTGASSHSWRGLAPLLAQRFAVTAFDLPGHGFTRGTPPGGLSIAAMSASVGALLQALELRPGLAVGHSAGAAILCRACLDGQFSPRGLVSLNGALLPLQRLQKALFAPIARLLALSPLSAALFAWSARDRRAVERLLAGTGSRLDAQGLELYWRLTRCRSHVDGALRMMAQWDLDALERALPRLEPALLLLVGGADRMVPPADAARVRALLPRASLMQLPHLGHLAHEERPDLVCGLIESFAAGLGLA